MRDLPGVQCPETEPRFKGRARKIPLDNKSTAFVLLKTEVNVCSDLQGASEDREWPAAPPSRSLSESGSESLALTRECCDPQERQTPAYPMRLGSPESAETGLRHGAGVGSSGGRGARWRDQAAPLPTPWGQGRKRSPALPLTRHPASSFRG